MDLYRLIKNKNINDGLTVVTVVHDINLASSFCNRIIFLKDGRIVADGTPHEVVRYAKIRDVFETEVYVGINDLTGMPYYVPFVNQV
jgi:iron complex transport system ATP-binding protein